MKLRFSTPMIATAIAALLLLASCSSKTNKEGKMIPKNAGYVMHIDCGSLTSKLNIAEIKQSDWYKQIMAELHSDTTAPAFIAKLRDNAMNSGIDSTADVIMFTENKFSEGMKVVVEGGIKDAKAFESFIKNIYPEGSVSKDGDINVMPIQGKAMLTWNSNYFVAAIRTPAIGGMNAFGKDRGNDAPKNAEGTEELQAYCKKIYSLKDDENLSKDEKFSELMDTKGDMHLWMNTDKLMDNPGQMGMLSMMKLDKFTEGNITTYTVNFEDGKVSLKFKTYFGKELGAIIKKYSGGKMNTDMIKAIPSNNLVGLFAVHFDPEAIREMVKLTGMDGLIDLILSRMGFTMDDVIKATKGDFVFAVSDIGVKQDSVRHMDAKGKMKAEARDVPDAKFLLAVAIGDKDAFNKLIKAGKEAAGDDKVSYNSNGTYFAIGDSPEYVAKYLAGDSKNENPFLSKISGSAAGGYIDIQKILKTLQPLMIRDSIDRIMIDESVKIWDNIILSGGDYSNGGYNQTVEVNLMDKNTNSLKSLFRYLVTVGKLEKDKQAKKKLERDKYQKDFLGVDSTKTVIFTPPRIVKNKKKK